MKKSVLVAVIVGVMVLVGACSSGEASSTTSSTEDLVTSTTIAATTTTDTSLPAGVFETVSYEQTERHFTYAGEWKTSSNGRASGGSFVFANSGKASLTVRFVGTGVSWIAKKSPKYGVAEVTVDGVSAGTVDLYSAEEEWRQVVWESDALVSDAHTVSIAWTGQKSEDATDTNISVDAVEVTGVLTGRYQETNEKVVYAGEWKASRHSLASGETFAFANTSGATATIRFNGIALTWLAKKSPVYGEGQVTVDGGSPVTVDLYSADTLWRQEVWSSGILGSGSHTVIIQWTGGKNDAATDTNINVDYFDVTGTLE
jgi:hypothetical protein